jgi:hypothetical protein
MKPWMWAGVVVGFAGVASGATFSVTNVADSGPNSLREAILDSNATPPGPNVIQFTGSMFATNATIRVGTQLDITEPVTLIASNRITLKKNASSTNRLVRVQGVTGDVTFDNFTFEGGDSAVNGGGGLYVNGASTVVIFRNGMITNCTSTVRGGAVLVSGGATYRSQRARYVDNFVDGPGGAIAIEDGSTVFLRSCVFETNTATGSGGGVYLVGGTAELRNCTFVGNRASTTFLTDSSTGGGLYVGTGATGTVGNCLFSRNVDAFAFPQYPDVSGTVDSLGYNLVRNGTGASGFTATGDQVGTTSEPLDLLLTGARPDPKSIARDGGSGSLLTADMVLDVDGDPRVAVRSVDVGAIELQPDGVVTTTNDHGAGSLREVLDDLSRHNSWVTFDTNVFAVQRIIVLTNNTSGLIPRKGFWLDGASAPAPVTIQQRSSASLRIFGINPLSIDQPVGTNAVEISDLTLVGGNASGEGFGQGACLLAHFGSTVTMRRCLIMGTRGKTVLAAASGASLLLENCTLSANTNVDTFSTGIAWAASTGQVDFVHCTITKNVVLQYPLDEPDPSAGISLFGTIVTGNRQTSSSTNVVRAQIRPGRTNLLLVGYNVVGDPGELAPVVTGTNNYFGYRTFLGPLTNNGGYAWSHALLPGSVGMSAASTNLSDPVPADDQRGEARPQGGAPDIGAYEAGTYTYAQWRDQIFPASVASTNRQAYDDPDGDRLLNVVEYYTGSDPATPSPDAWSFVPEPGTNGTTEYAFYVDRAIGVDVDYAGVQLSTNLLTWATSLTNFTVVGSDFGFDTLRVVVPGPTTSRKRGYVRLNVIN